MKSTLLFASALLISGLCLAKENDVPHVSVFGTAVKEVEPDLLRWRISITWKGADIETVAENQSKEVSEALSFLKAQGIATDKTQTSRMTLSENREYRNNSWVKVGYQASTVISFTSTNLSSYRDLWLGISKLKGASVDSSNWDTSRRIELQNDTRVEALKAAREKAAVMASTLGMKIAEPLVIEEPASPQDDARFNVVLEGYTAPGGAGETIAPGTIEIRVRVFVSFQIVPE